MADISKAPGYKAWGSMKQRCYNPSDPAYAHYGGRGITMCDAWRTSFHQFRADMGPRPSPLHSVERIDNEGPYALFNCRWATKKEQQRNRRGNVRLIYSERVQTIAAWADEIGLDYDTLYSRVMLYMWTVRDALTKPIGKGGRKPKAVAA